MSQPRLDLVRRYGSAARLKAAAAVDAALRDEIKAELAAIKGIDPGRCVMTNEYRQALQQALET